MAPGNQKEKAGKKSTRSPTVDVARKEITTDDRPAQAKQSRPQARAGAPGRAESERLLQRQAGNTRQLASNRQTGALATVQRRNRSVSGIQRKPLPQAEGRQLGLLHSPANMGNTITLFARLEIVPSTAEAGQFAGYAKPEEAEFVARRRHTIVAMLRDYDKRFHLFDTGVPSSRYGPEPPITPRESGHGYTFVNWLNVRRKPQASGKEWAALVEDAREKRAGFESKYGKRFYDNPKYKADRQIVESAYLALLAEALSVSPQKLHAMHTLVYPGQGKDGGDQEFTSAQPGMINFDIFQFYGGISAYLDPMSATNERPGEFKKVSLPEDPYELPVPPLPFLSLGPAALIGYSPLLTLESLVHEEAHDAHKRRTLELYLEWAAINPSITFKAWLEKEMKNKRRADPVTEVDKILATEPTINDRKHNTETLAEVAGFTAVYHLLPLGDPEQTSLDRLPKLAGYWINAESTIQELSIRQLHYYYKRMLGKEHKKVFESFVREKLKEARQAKNNNALQRMAKFYERLARFQDSF